ncbi:hypothetical protein [Streptomyces qinglanensis]|uniref:Aminoglycoside/hydroxyurea antibiotic resistance kinase n=1 Tax=Streptomyces qinglanensis TaxID=943816 RepID=A0A1H9S4C7_9ACTN|nr:hypothetical protein [Streptomyces qinglanensis]SER79778.1 Aminoglycoside/hydroxyurea antibiotic resistance kinase [Streptomyces qinglanensis]
MTDLFPPALPVLTAMSRTADGRGWLAGLPTLVEQMRERWQLRLHAPFHGGSCSWAAPAELPDGTRAVLKLTWPHPEARTEGAALDPAFDPWPLLEQIDAPFAHADPHRVLRHRTALLAEALGEDADRIRAWSVARHVEYALWSVDEDESLDHSITLLRQARILADLAGL